MGCGRTELGLRQEAGHDRVAGDWKETKSRADEAALQNPWYKIQFQKVSKTESENQRAKATYKSRELATSQPQTGKTEVKKQAFMLPLIGEDMIQVSW